MQLIKSENLKVGQEYATIKGDYLGEFQGYRFKMAVKQAYFKPFAQDTKLAKDARGGISINLPTWSPKVFIELPKTQLIKPAFDRGVNEKLELCEKGEPYTNPYDFNSLEYYSYLSGYNSI